MIWELINGNWGLIWEVFRSLGNIVLFSINLYFIVKRETGPIEYLKLIIAILFLNYLK